MRSMTFGGTAGAISAALASVGLVVLAALYLVPFGDIVCGFGRGVSPPAITAGGAYFGTPRATRVTISPRGEVFLDDKFIPAAQLEETLRARRALMPNRPLELKADRRLSLRQLAPTLAAMRGAGYDSFYVFGRESAVLELMSRRLTADRR